MNKYDHKKQENKAAAVNHQDTGDQALQFAENTSETLVQRKLQEIADNSSRSQQLKTIQKKANGHISGSAPVQLAAANVVGRTHLVGMHNGSLMQGLQGSLLQNGTELDVDQHSRIISRRGPNQELVGSYDHRGAHMYRWYKVNDVQQQDITARNMYIRENTFRFGGNEGNHFRAHNLEGMGERRTRQSHIAIRLDVWYNENRKIDQTGHMLMEDYSHHGRRSMYEYTWGADHAIDPHANKVEATPMSGDSESSQIDHEGVSGIGPVKSKHKLLVTKQESPGEKATSMRGQRRYPNEKGGFNMNPPANSAAAVQPVSRFNKKKSVEILVTKREYDVLKRMYHLRQQGGFYCFFREARTVHGYQLATRCLSFLEDIAIMRRQTQLQPGHAADVLHQFAEINQVTDAHQNESPV